MKKNLKWFILLLLLIIAAVVAWRVFSKNTPAEATPTRAQTAAASNIATFKITPDAQAGQTSFDGVVESVRQSMIAAQVPGAIKEIHVKAGDRVGAGQVLIRIDGQAAEQAAIAARAEYERQVLLFKKQYISQAALDQAKVQLAQATAQSGYFLLRAPFSGVITEVNAKLGEMAMPGMPLMQMFDPSAMRISAQVPQTQIGSVQHAANARIELAGMNSAEQWLTPATMEVLPAVDARTHSATLRLPLPKTNVDLVPGTFARVWMSLPAAEGQAQKSIWIPNSSVLRRGEIHAVYVKSSHSGFLMRQVRLGQTQGETVQVLTGLSADDEIALDAQTVLSTNAPESK